VLGKTIGLRPTLWISVAGGLLSFIPPLLSPVRTLEKIPEQAPVEGEGPVPAPLDEGVVEAGHPPPP